MTIISESSRSTGKYVLGTAKDLDINWPIANVIRKHKIVGLHALGYVLQVSGAISPDPSRKFRPSEVKKWAERQGFTVLETGCGYVTTVAGAAAQNMVHNSRHEAAVCAVELAALFAGEPAGDFLDWDHKRKAGEHLADLYLAMNDGTVGAVEIELTQKDRKRLNLIIAEHLEQTQRGDYSQVMYLAHGTANQKAIERAAEMAPGLIHVIDLNEWFADRIKDAGGVMTGTRVVA